jgi:ABC-type protease/lipase transport system fused ATPase/permease subunit
VFSLEIHNLILVSPSLPSLIVISIIISPRNLSVLELELVRNDAVDILQIANGLAQTVMVS